MISLFARSVFRRIVVALYVLGLILPASVQAGFQLTRTVEYQLLKDIAESRCLSNKNEKSQHHEGQDCCILAEDDDIPEPILALTQQLEVPISFRYQTAQDQTVGLKLGQSLLLPTPRGPPTPL
jgi:hypothetical protein